MPSFGWLGVAALLGSATAAVAADLPVETVDQFLAEYDALQAKAKADPSPPDVKARWPEVMAVTQRVRDDAKAYRADVDAAIAAGKPPRACLPPPGKAQVTGDALVAAYRALPAAKRAEPERVAFYAYMDSVYRCPR